MNLKEKTVLFFATGFFSGRLPYMPGTFGTVLGLPVAFLLAKATAFTAAVWIVVFVAAAVWISHQARQALKVDDPACIVVDEIAGYLVTLWGIPFNPVSAAAGFVLFRFFDIVKPFPIRWLEKKVPGGAGIVADDILAGIFANLLLRILLLAGTA